MKAIRKSIINEAAKRLSEIWAAEPVDPFKIESMSTDKGCRGVAWREASSTGTFEVLRDSKGWWTRTTLPSGSVSRHRIETRIARLLVGEALLNPRGTVDLKAVARLLIGGAQ